LNDASHIEDMPHARLASNRPKYLSKAPASYADRVSG
jgi:hypothetical protein